MEHNHLLTNDELTIIGRIVVVYRLQLYYRKGNGTAFDILIISKLLEQPLFVIFITVECIRAFNSSELAQPDGEIWHIPMPGGIFLQWKFVDKKLHMRAVGADPDTETEETKLANQIISDNHIAILTSEMIGD